LLGTCDRPLGHSETVGDLPGVAQGFGHLGQKYEGPRGEALFPEVVKAGTQ
jgi:hypothetical protein